MRAVSSSRTVVSSAWRRLPTLHTHCLHTHRLHKMGITEKSFRDISAGSMAFERISVCIHGPHANGTPGRHQTSQHQTPKAVHVKHMPFTSFLDVRCLRGRPSVS